MVDIDVLDVYGYSMLYSVRTQSRYLPVIAAIISRIEATRWLLFRPTVLCYIILITPLTTPRVI